MNRPVRTGCLCLFTHCILVTAQARKEEMWHKAKQHGEMADKHADKHFLASHADHRFATGHDTYDAAAMTSAGSTTREVMRNAGDQL